MGDIPGHGTATARAVIYRFLSSCLSYPDRDLVELFDRARFEEFQQAWRCLGMGSESMDRAADWLTKWPSQNAALLELQKEYTRLFITAYPTAVVPPYSSLYLDSEKLVWGPSTAEAARLYEAAGLGLNESFHDVPDHIAAEMELASHLIAEQSKSHEHRIGQLLSLEKRFLTEHLYKWAPAFFNRVIECSSVGFYQAVALTGRRFIDRDITHLSRFSS